MYIKVYNKFLFADMEDECFPAISVNTAFGRLTGDANVMIKDEPLSESDSPHSSCPSSPQPAFVHHSDTSMDTDIVSRIGFIRYTYLKTNNFFLILAKLPKYIETNKYIVESAQQYF